MRRVAPALLALAALAGWVACDKVTPVAPTDSTLTISANPTRIDADGEAVITVIARKGDGTPVNPGTQINFSTSLGTIEEVVSTGNTGVATAILKGDGRIGTATVRASSGAAGEVMVDVQIGSLAASITLQPTPTSLPKEGGEIRLLALVRDDNGQPLRDTAVNFETDAGTLASFGAAIFTNASGEARDVLTVTESDLLVLGETFFQVRALAASTGGTLIEDVFDIEIRGVVSSISLQATPSTIPAEGGSTTLLALVRDSAGNAVIGAAVNFITELGNLASGGGLVLTVAGGQATDTLTVSEAELGAFDQRTITVSAQTIGFGGVEKTATFEVRIEGAQPDARFDVSIAGLTVSVVNLTTGSEQGIRWLWDWGDGKPQSSVRNPSPHTYDAPGGTFTITLVATNDFGSDSFQRMVTVSP